MPEYIFRVDMILKTEVNDVDKLHDEMIEAMITIAEKNDSQLSGCAELMLYCKKDVIKVHGRG